MVDGLLHHRLIVREEAGLEGGADGQHLEPNIGFLALVENVERRIGDVGNGSLAGLAALGELQIEDHALHGVGLVGHVGDKVAQAVGHEALLLFTFHGLHVDHLHFTDDMTVGTEDHVHAVFQQQIGDVLLGTADGRVILSAPVQHGDDDVGGFGLGGVQPVHDAGGIDDAVVGVVVRIEKVHTVFRVQRQRHIVQALGKGDEGDLDAVDFPDHIAAGGAGVTEMGADCFDPGGVEDIHGGGQTVDAVHNRVGVGRLEDVKADIRQILGQNIRRVEIGRGPGIAGIGRRTAEVQLQIAHGQICAGGIRLDGREAIGKVIGGVLLLGGVDLVLIHHDIAHGGQGGGFIRLHRLGLFRHRRRRRHNLLLRRLLFGRAAADDQHHGQN